MTVDEHDYRDIASKFDSALTFDCGVIFTQIWYLTRVFVSSVPGEPKKLNRRVPNYLLAALIVE